MQAISSTNKKIHYIPNSGDTGLAEYRLFKPAAVGSKGPVCVFSNARGYGLFTEVPIASAVCEEEKMDPLECDFFELRTHIGWNQTPSGHYHFVKLDFKEERGVLHDTEWTDYECPFAVFQAFAHLIGGFWTLDELVSPSNPLYGKAYQKFTPTRLRQEKDDLARHLEWLSQWGPRSYEKHPNKILLPTEAKRRGYVFNPGCRYNCVPDDLSKYEREGVFVDLNDSHLLGQHSSTGFSFEPCGQPKRFSFWRRLHS